MYNVIMNSDYRVIRTNNDTIEFNIHEVFFDEEGIPVDMDKQPVNISSKDLTTLTQKCILVVGALSKPTIDSSLFNTDYADSQQQAMDIFKNV